MRGHKKGYQHSQETREKIGASHRGQKRPPFSPEHRERMALAQTGSRNHQWKGGLRRHGGYLLELCPNHPNADNKGYVPQHRLRMEAHLGRTLLPTEVVHHINGIRDDNRIENLMLFPGRGAHTNYHKKLEAEGQA